MRSLQPTSASPLVGVAAWGSRTASEEAGANSIGPRNSAVGGQLAPCKPQNEPSLNFLPMS